MALAKKNPQSSVVDQDQQKTLKEELQLLETRFRVKFAFNEEVVEGKRIRERAPETEDVEAALATLLRPLQLRYVKVDERNYVIKSASRRRGLRKVTSQALPVPESGLGSYSARTTRLPVSSVQLRSWEQTVTGTVTDQESNEPLPGVNVVIKGTTTGTVTDVEGTYRIEAPDAESVLVFSSIGYLSEEIVVGNRSVIDMTLSPDVKSLEEVVVIGYGSREKKDVTTSISSIDAETINKSTVSMNPELAMQGRMTGVQVSGNTGNPMDRPTVRIRGVNTWGVSEPLYVVDGIPITELGAGIEGAESNRVKDVRGPINIMTMIDPNDIESISVLKDASAAAIYGVRAANGVVLITTKKGKTETPSIDFSARYGVQNLPRTWDVLNTQPVRRLLRCCLRRQSQPGAGPGI